MPEVVNFEIIGLEDIGKDILKPSSLQRQPSKLSKADVENLTHYLHRYHQPLPNKKSNFEIVSTNPSTHHHRYHSHNYINITDDFHSDRPLTDIYHYHHHYRRRHHHHQQAKQAPEPVTTTTTSASSNEYQSLALEIASCGMKKNTRLPVPVENFFRR